VAAAVAAPEAAPAVPQADPASARAHPALPAPQRNGRSADTLHAVGTAAPVPVPQAGAPSLVLLRRIGVVDPSSLDDYRANGGYAALRRAFSLGPAGVIREVLEAGLVGRGGAAFPTGRKWDATARQPDHPHYLVCNADESEPGTFKDRVLMEAIRTPSSRQ